MPNYTGHYGASYTSKITSPHQLRKLVTALCKKIEAVPVPEFTSLACCGVGGIGVASLLAVRLKKSLTIVRKKADRHGGCHSDYPLEGRITKRYLIVDDCVASGCTVQHIFTTIGDVIADARCVGVLLHARPGPDRTTLVFRGSTMYELPVWYRGELP